VLVTNAILHAKSMSIPVGRAQALFGQRGTTRIAVVVPASGLHTEWGHKIYGSCPGQVFLQSMGGEFRGRMGVPLLCLCFLFLFLLSLCHLSKEVSIFVFQRECTKSSTLNPSLTFQHTAEFLENVKAQTGDVIALQATEDGEGAQATHYPTGSKEATEFARLLASGEADLTPPAKPVADSPPDNRAARRSRLGQKANLVTTDPPAPAAAAATRARAGAAPANNASVGRSPANAAASRLNRGGRQGKPGGRPPDKPQRSLPAAGPVPSRKRHQRKQPAPRRASPGSPDILSYIARLSEVDKEAFETRRAALAAAMAAGSAAAIDVEAASDAVTAAATLCAVAVDADRPRYSAWPPLGAAETMIPENGINLRAHQCETG
jgi:hypothetical protein